MKRTLRMLLMIGAAVFITAGLTWAYQEYRRMKHLRSIIKYVAPLPLDHKGRIQFIVAYEARGGISLLEKFRVEKTGETRALWDVEAAPISVGSGKHYLLTNSSLIHFHQSSRRKANVKNRVYKAGVSAHSLRDGSLQWTHTFENRRQAVYRFPRLFGNLVLATTISGDENQGFVTALDTKTGKRVWESRPGKRPRVEFHGVRIAGRHIYVSTGLESHAIDAQTGTSYSIGRHRFAFRKNERDYFYAWNSAGERRILGTLKHSRTGYSFRPSVMLPGAVGFSNGIAYKDRVIHFAGWNPHRPPSNLLYSVPMHGGRSRGRPMGDRFFHVISGSINMYEHFRPEFTGQAPTRHRFQVLATRNWRPRRNADEAYRLMVLDLEQPRIVRRSSILRRVNAEKLHGEISMLFRVGPRYFVLASERRGTQYTLPPTLLLFDGNSGRFTRAYSFYTIDSNDSKIYYPWGRVSFDAWHVRGDLFFMRWFSHFAVLNLRTGRIVARNSNFVQVESDMTRAEKHLGKLNPSTIRPPAEPPTAASTSAKKSP